MAVESALHRRGIGRALVGALEADLLADGVELLQVKTLGPSLADVNYERTRQFYGRMGFRPLEEVPDLWPGNPSALTRVSFRHGAAVPGNAVSAAIRLRGLGMRG